MLKNKTNLAAVLFFITLIAAAFLLAMSLRVKRIEPREILAGQYYDYSSQFEYTFQLGEKKYAACDVHTLDEDEYDHFEDYPVSYPVDVRFDDASMTAVISGVLSEKGTGYYVFRDEYDRILLIPAREKRGLFEYKRPLAFYLLEQFPHAQLQTIADDSGAMEDYRARYTPNCVRELEDGAFRMTFPGDNEIAVVLFDASGEKTHGWVYHLSAESAKLEDLKIGDSLDLVMAADPDGSYPFLYAGRDDFPKASEHYCKDGRLITIHYSMSSSGEYVISSILKEWI